MIDIIVAVVSVAIIGVSIYAAFFHKGSPTLPPRGGGGGDPGDNGDNGDNGDKFRRDEE